MALSDKRKILRHLALLNAAAMINDHCNDGLMPEHIGLSPDDDDGLMLYQEECKSAAKRITTMADRFQRAHDL